MIKEEQAKKLAETLKMDAEQTTEFVTAATSAEEQDVTIPELKVFTTEELIERDNNLIEPVKAASYAEGKTAGVEMDVKVQREKHGLEFDGKTSDNLLDAYKSHILKDAGKEPDKRNEELEKEKLNLQSTIKTMNETHAGELLKRDEKIAEHAINAIIETALTSGYPDGLTKADVRLMIKNAREFTYDENGKLVIKKNGEVLKDSMENHLSINEAVKGFYDERGWKEGKPAGRNNDDDFGTDANTIVEFKRVQSADDLDKYCKKHSLLPQSDTILAMMTKHMTKEQRKKIFSS